MSSQGVDKTVLVDSLLESLHYGTIKEDTTIIEHLCSVFRIPDKKNCRSYLIKAVDFSELFSEVLKLVEPFAQMMNEIYRFLAEQRKTARSLEHVIVGEDIKDKISFDLEVFPQLYQPVIQQIEEYLRFYSLDHILDNNISPLFLTEGLFGCDYCNDIHYQKPASCQECGTEMQMRFEKVFQQLAQTIAIIPEEVKNREPYRRHCRYFEEANKLFHTKKREGGDCWGYKRWSKRLDEIEWRINLVSKKQPGFYELEAFIRFFELPFWKERNRLYEVWTLIHFVHLLRKLTLLWGASFELNIRDNQWYLVYGDAREPIAWIQGNHFKIEIWYQRKLKTGLKMFPDIPVEPEMLLIYHSSDSVSEPLMLIECKERKDYDVREIMKLSAFYRAQVHTALNIFCNYFDYSLPKTFQMSSDEPPIILCSQFRPGQESIAEVDREFMKLLNKKLGPLHTVLIDVSASMRGKDLKFVYQRLDMHLSSLHGVKGLSGVFAEQVVLCNYSDLITKLSHTLNVGNSTQLKKALDTICHEIRKNSASPVITNFYIITDLDFRNEDWNLLESIDADPSCSIMLVARKSWISDSSRQRVEQFERIKLKLF